MPLGGLLPYGPGRGGQDERTGGMIGSLMAQNMPRNMASGQGGHAGNMLAGIGKQERMMDDTPLRALLERVTYRNKLAKLKNKQEKNKQREISDGVKKLGG